MNRILLFFVVLVATLTIMSEVFGYAAPELRDNDPWDIPEHKDHLSCFLLFSLVAKDPEASKELEEKAIPGRSPDDVVLMIEKMVPQIRRRWEHIQNIYGIGKPELQRSMDKIEKALQVFRSNPRGDVSWVPYLEFRWEHCSQYAEEVIK